MGTRTSLTQEDLDLLMEEVRDPPRTHLKGVLGAAAEDLLRRLRLLELTEGIEVRDEVDAAISAAIQSAWNSSSDRDRRAIARRLESTLAAALQIEEICL